MEVYVSDLPRCHGLIQTRMLLIEAISGVVHSQPVVKPGDPKPNFDVVVRERTFEHQRSFRRNSRRRASSRLIGTVTFPKVDLGEAFLNAVRNNPIQLDGHAVSFAQSLKAGRKIVPHPELVRTLKATPFKTSVQRLTELAQHESLQQPVPISHLKFGRKSNYGSLAVFSSECELNTPTEGCQLKFDLEDNAIVIRWETHLKATISLAINMKTLLKIEAQNSSVLLSLESPPAFEIGPLPPAFEIESFPNSFVAMVELFRHFVADRRFRVAGLASWNLDALPYVNDQLRITFTTPAAFQEFCFRKTLFQLPDIIYQDRLVVKTGMYNINFIDNINDFLEHLPISVAFQLEALLRNGILDHLQILLVDDQSSGLNESHRERALIKFIQMYDPDADALDIESGQSVDGHYLDLLDHAIIATRDEITPTDPRIAAGDSFSCRAVIITPTRLQLKGPSIEQSNSIIRKYQKPENFLRVSLRDEGGCALYATGDIDMTDLLETRYLGFMTEGLFVCGRKFEFLGYSNSSLKTQQCWFVCPFEMNGLLVNAATIRDKLGDFSKVIHNPARYMARIGQALTSTRQSVTLHPSQVLWMEDVERNGYCFTDGVGTISQELADEVNDVLRAGSTELVRPTCFQIRLGGIKGMLAVDSLLRGKVVRVRPSMEKFKAPNHPLPLDIAGVSQKPLAAYLNRPLIKLLEDLGIQEHVFLNLQKQMILKVEKSRTSLRLSTNLMQQCSTTNKGGIKILKNLADLLGECSTFQSHFLNSCYDLTMMECLRGLKYHAHIPLEKSYSLYGVADEDNILKGYEIYACVQMTTQSPPVYLQGLMMISRAPSHHPGDVRVVLAVGKPDPKYAPRLASLVNCVVFSVRGDRPLPSCLGGGDLDGDHYILIGLPDLIPDPNRIHKPAAYGPPERMELDRESTIEDGAKFFLSHISNNNVGIISTRQLHIADHCDGGILHEDCIRLAQLHSEAVDYPKNGVPVQLEEMPVSSIKMKPDFMCAENHTRREGYEFYESDRVLGKLFRQIPAQRIDTLSQQIIGSRTEASETKPLGNPGEKLRKIDPDGMISKEIQRRLSRVAVRLPSGDAALRRKFDMMLDWFAEELMTLCRLNGLSSRREDHLSEAEAFLGVLATKTSDKGLKESAAKQLEAQTSQLFENLRHKILEPKQKEGMAKKQKENEMQEILPEERVEQYVKEDTLSLNTSSDKGKEGLRFEGKKRYMEESTKEGTDDERDESGEEYDKTKEKFEGEGGIGFRQHYKAEYDGKCSEDTKRSFKKAKMDSGGNMDNTSDHNKGEGHVAAVVVELQKGSGSESLENQEKMWEKNLCQAYAAWVASNEAKAGKFGANTFGLIALDLLTEIINGQRET